MQRQLQGRPLFWKIGWFLSYMAMVIFTGTGPHSVMQPGASPGSSVGNVNDWILFLSSIAVVFCLCSRSATSRSVQNTPKYRFVDPKYHFLTNKGEKNQNRYFRKFRIFCSMIRRTAKCHVFFFEWGLFGSQKRTWVTWGKSTTYPHDTGKIGHFFKIRVFHETWVGWGVDGSTILLGTSRTPPGHTSR